MQSIGSAMLCAVRPRRIREGTQARIDARLTAMARYEAGKQAWIASHPDSTPEQYTQAMRALAQRCGV